MSNGLWTDAENDLIVADYFAMLADEIAGQPYSKAERRRALLPLLNDRSESSVELKHQNISAVLKGFGEASIPGYKPPSISRCHWRTPWPDGWRLIRLGWEASTARSQSWPVRGSLAMGGIGANAF